MIKKGRVEVFTPSYEKDIYLTTCAKANILKSACATFFLPTRAFVFSPRVLDPPNLLISNANREISDQPAHLRRLI